MALISCPGCGNPLSDKAAVCPNCGSFALGRNDDYGKKIICEDCGNEFENNLISCPVCGCPAFIHKSKTDIKKSKIIAVSLIVILLLAVSLAGISISKEAKLSQYNESMNAVLQTTYEGAVKAENVGNLVKNVWSNAIYRKHDERTDKYTMQNGVFVDDFNDALNNLLSDDDLRSMVLEIRENQSKATDLMKELNDPPKKYQEAYSMLRDYYDNYIKLTNAVINPTGSLNSFSEDFNQYSADTLNQFDKMQLYID